MTTASWALLVMAAIAAMADWVAVGLRLRTVEYACKPLTLGFLIAVAATLHPVVGLRRAYVLAALSFSLLGDVVLMLPGARSAAHSPHAGTTSSGGDAARDRDRPPRRAALDLFLPGLGFFLIAHVDYIAGFRVDGPALDRVGLGVLVVAPVAIPLGTVIARALVRDHLAPLRIPVVLYMAVIWAMVASAIATGSALATAGAWLFLASDAILALDRFVRPWRWSPLAVIVTYHAAQALLVASLVRS